MQKDYLEFEKPVFDAETKLAELVDKNEDNPTKSLLRQIGRAEKKLSTVMEKTYGNLTPWQRVQLARHPKRPFMLDYAELAFDEFVEIHGDRHIGDDEAMPCGFAQLGEIRVALIGHQKGRETKENLRRNFGSAHPEGYRKALRVMRMAEKFELPVVCLIDTPGAFPGVGAEERNIAEAIAFNLREMTSLRTPIVSVVIGEGGSGGALGIGVADRVLMLENAYYSVISPEGCAAILWKDRSKAAEASEALKLSADSLKRLGIIDGVIAEPGGGAHRDPHATAAALRRSLFRHLRDLSTKGHDTLLEERYQKFRAMGEFDEVVA